MIPSRATYQPTEDVVLELDAPLASAGTVTVTHLEKEVAHITADAGVTDIALGTFAVGGYGVQLGELRTAFDVLESRWDRPRYGFVVTMSGDVDVNALTRTFRRLHINAAQFYDWAYKHSQLMPPEPIYLDPLGQERDMRVVDTMSQAFSEVGVTPMGYAAVYAIGHDEMGDWESSIIHRDDGEPYRLGDNFLVLVDPADPTWLPHLASELAQVIDNSRIEGFHLDQYGWPKFATKANGERVDLAESYRTLLTRLREELPTAPFMFNNVNDFPTPVTAPLPQNATYIEVWEPHSTLGDLGSLAAAAWNARPDHPPILSAYLSCYKDGDEAAATAAARLVMATAYSHGATHLLLGETGHALTDPYYPDNHVLTPNSLDQFVQWYDFAVRYGDLLYGPVAEDVTEYFTGGINEDVVVDAGDIPVSTKADPGSLWVRVVRRPEGVLVHIINLVAQHETGWDHVKAPVRDVADATMSVSFLVDDAQVLVATPSEPDLVPLTPAGRVGGDQHNSLSAGQGGQRFNLPVLGDWTMVWIPATSIGV